MKHHRQMPALTLALMLAWQVEIVRSEHEQIIVGTSEEGTRYYIEPWPSCMARSEERTETRTVAGIECSYVKPDLRRAQFRHPYHWEHQMLIYTVDDVKGSKEYLTTEFSLFGTPQINSDPFFYSDRKAYDREPESHHWLPRSNPAVKAAKRFLKRDQVFVTRHEEKPVANGVYYGFNETGFGLTMWFDENSRVKDFKVQGSGKGWFNRLDYAMVGKAVKGTFRRDHRKLESLLLGRVDPDEFDGSVASFSRARVKTLEGVPVDNQR